MKNQTFRLLVVSVVAVVGWLGAGVDGRLVGSAEAVVGRPATPVSYAGVARRSTVRHAAAVTPGVAPVATAAVVAPVATAAVLTPGVGAPGVGVQPANRGGPVNRVGVR
jgi:hypothetical protein